MSLLNNDIDLIDILGDARNCVSFFYVSNFFLHLYGFLIDFKYICRREVFIVNVVGWQIIYRSLPIDLIII